MILSNVHKFEFTDKSSHDFRNLVTSGFANGSNILLCPKLGTIYTWWQPETSPNNGEGGWSRLKTVELQHNGRPVSLWDKQVAYSCHPDIRKIVEEQINCYIVPMKDIVYSLTLPYVSEGTNFHIFIKNDDKFYSTNLKNNSNELMVVSNPNNYTGTLYSIETNDIVYQYDEWLTVDNETNYSQNMVVDGTQTPETPKTPECKKRLFDEEGIPELDKDEHFDNEVHNINMSMKVIETSSDSSASPSHQLLDDSSDSDSSYKPSESSDQEEDWNDDAWSDDAWNDDAWDEKRQDINGEWYTRREFYDYYGTDDAWDNLDKNVYQKYRFDENDGKWYTKEEFFQYYGSYHVWKKMNPKKRLKRMSIERAYWYASYLPCRLQDRFIKDFISTY